jgi:hypothetical protein
VVTPSTVCLEVRRMQVDLDCETYLRDRQVESSRAVAGKIDQVLPFEAAHTGRSQGIAQHDFTMRFSWPTVEPTIDDFEESPDPRTPR